MITTLILYFFYAMLSLIVAILPVAPEIPTAATAWIPYFQAGVDTLDFFIPIEQFLIVLGLFLSIEFSLVGYRAALFIYKRIRG